MSWIESLSTSCEIAFMILSQDPNLDYSTSVQVMAWCRQATSHYLHQCWPTSMSPYGVIRPQWVDTALDRIAWYKTLRHEQMAAVLQTILWIAFSWIKIIVFLLNSHLTVFFEVQSTMLSQVMAWGRAGGKPYSKTMMTQFTDSYTLHQASVS